MARDKRPDPTQRLRLPTFADRAQARLAGLGKAASAIVTSPEPLWTGDAAAARRLANGVLMLGGSLAEARGKSPWEVEAPSFGWLEALHGHDWLDHAAAAEPETRAALIGWLFDWIDRYGGGAGPGWRPDLAGRRLSRWICHAPVILSGAGPERSRAFFRAVARQARYLKRRWRAAPPGLPRFQAAAGLIYAGLAVEGASGAVIRTGIAALGRECQRRIGPDGGVATRRPSDLVEILKILVWAAQSLDEAGLAPTEAHADAIRRLAPAVRALRLGDGSMARFHGGGGGDPEQIDRALAATGVRPGRPLAEVMGFHRISTARSIIVFDAGGGAFGPEATDHHASTFCFEASIGRRPMIVNCGPGAGFGPEWRRAARATAAHSGLTIDDVSSSRISTGRGAGRRAGWLMLGVREIECVREEDAQAVRLVAQHDGYLASHGLIHQRRLTISADGGDIRGEDRVVADGAGPRAAFDQAAGRGNRMSVPYTIRFHLHPDMEADLFLAGGAVRLRPPSGDFWVMRQLGGAMTIEDSVYLDDRRVTPRPTRQIVVRAEAKNYAGVVKWAFRRAEPDKPAPRDLAVAEAEA